MKSLFILEDESENLLPLVVLNILGSQTRGHMRLFWLCLFSRPVIYQSWVPIPDKHEWTPGAFPVAAQVPGTHVSLSGNNLASPTHKRVRVGAPQLCTDVAEQRRSTSRVQSRVDRTARGEMTDACFKHNALKEPPS